MKQLFRWFLLFFVITAVLLVGSQVFISSWYGKLQNITVGSPLERLGTILQTDVLKEIGVGEKKEFVSIDGKLRVPYPAGWIEFPREQLSAVFPTKETATPLFLLQKISAGSIAQFFGVEIQMETNTFDEFLEKFAEDMQKRGWNTKIVSAEPDDFGGTFESQYSLVGGQAFHAKERVILKRESLYLFSFFAQETNWNAVSGQATSMLSSLQYTNQ